MHSQNLRIRRVVLPIIRYEHSSISATLNELFGLANLTRRDAWAASLLSLLDEPAPRTDAPLHLVDAPPPTRGVPATHSCGPADELTRRHARRVGHFEQLAQRRRAAGEAAVGGGATPEDRGETSALDGMTPEAAERYIIDTEAALRRELLVAAEL